MALNIGDLFGTLSLDTSKWDSGIDGALGALESIETELAIFAGAAAAAFGFAAKSGVDMAVSIEQARISFTTLTGSVETANQHLEDLEEFAINSIFEFDSALLASKKFQAMGLEAEKVIPTLTAIGNAAAASGASADDIDGIVTAMAQMVAKGKVSAEEMNQLAERGVSGWKLLAEAIGTDVPTAMKMAEQGAIAGGDAVAAMVEHINTNLAGSMDKVMNTLPGKISSLRSEVQSQLKDLAEPLKDSLTDLVGAVADVSGNITNGLQPIYDGLDVLARTATVAVEKFGELDDETQTYIATSTAATVAILAMASGFTVAASQAWKFAAGLYGVAAGFAPVIGVAVLAAATVAAHVVALGTLVRGYEWLRSVAASTWDTVKAYAIDAYQIAEAAFGGTLTVAIAAFNGIAKIVSVAFGAASDAILNSFIKPFALQMSFALDEFKMFVEFGIELFDTFMTFMRDAWLGVFEGVIINGIDMVAEAMEKLKPDSKIAAELRDIQAGLQGVKDTMQEGSYLDNAKAAIEGVAGAMDAAKINAIELAKNFPSQIKTSLEVGMDIIVPDSVQKALDDAAEAIQEFLDGATDAATEGGGKTGGKSGGTSGGGPGGLWGEGDTWDALADAELKASMENAFDDWSLGEGWDEIADAELAEVENATASFGETVRSTFKSIGGMILSAAPEVAGILDGAIQGFAAGGIAGAIGGVVTSLLDEFGLLDTILDPLVSIIGMLARAIEPVIAALEPVVDLLVNVLAVVIQALSPILQEIANLLWSLAPVFESIGEVVTALGPLMVLMGEYLGLIVGILNTVLGPALEGLSIVLGFIADIIMFFVQGIASVWNAIVEAIAWVLKKLGFKKLGNKFDDAAIDLDDYTMAVNRATAAVTETEEPFYTITADVSDMSDAVDDTASNFLDLNEELLNVPDGFKLATAAYEASTGDLMFSDVTTDSPISATDSIGTGGGGDIYYIDTMNVTANDAEEFSNSLSKAVGKAAIRTDGTRTLSTIRGK